jgi:RHS repeat-associated protein
MEERGDSITKSTRGKIIGEQVFGPYGERMEGTFNLNSSSTDTTSPIIQKTLPSGYRPVTGYTGHINEDQTGLIYMRGRYYSPAWHRFINSDQGVDPNSLNQYAYVGGSPFMATDPSGMDGIPSATVVMQYFADPIEEYYDRQMQDAWGWMLDGDKITAFPKGGGGGGAAGSSQTTQEKTKEEVKKDCEEYAEKLAGMALNYKTKYSYFTSHIYFGWDLYKMARKDISLSSFGLAPYYSGFKDDLVMGGQNSGVYRHVGASLGISLGLGGGILGLLVPTTYTLLGDMPDYINSGSLEDLAEMNGNAAGMLLVSGFTDFFSGGTTSSDLKQFIMNILCEK